jgi:uncharacterized protein (TIGR03067 family)
MLTESRVVHARRSTFKLVAAQPRLIDLTTLYEGNLNPVRTAGIYALEGDLLTYCVAPPGRSRPVEFATKRGDESTLVVLKRVSPQRP